VSLWSDFADYNRLRGDDQAWQTEGQFGIRLDDRGIRALRSGFGVYRGVGGSIEELDELGKGPRRSGLTYGYLEAELAPHESFSFIVRGMLGLEADGMSQGLQGHVRFGSDRSTNLTIGGEILGEVGLKGITQLEIAPASRFPVMLRSEVTNQPAGSSVAESEVRPRDPATYPANTSTEAGDLGVRGIAQFGYRLVPELVLAVRGSYQGRNIKHSGPGFGGAVVYTW
jgi:hypothetical protein